MEDGKYNRDINCLRDRDKNTRLAGLSRLLTSSKDETDLLALFGKLKIQLFDLLKDPADKCKEQAVALIRVFISNESVPPEDLSLLIQSFHYRIGQEQLIETCEEVRIASLHALRELSEKYIRFIHTELSRLTDIISRALRDKFPLCKLAASEFVTFLSENCEKVSLYSRKLVESLRINFFHQQFKVRVQSLQAVGSLLKLRPAQGLISEIWPDLKKVQLDKKFEVIESLNSAVFQILLSLDPELQVTVQDKLIYSLLCCSSNCEALLDSVGLNQPSDSCESFPGGRQVILNSFQSVVQLCLTDLQEWTLQDNFRSRAGNALIKIIEICGQQILTQIEAILPVLFKSFTYDQAEYLSRSVNLIGQCCDFSLIVSLISKYCLAGYSLLDVSSALKLLAKLMQDLPTDRIEPGAVLNLLNKLVECEDLAVLRDVHHLVQVSLQKFQASIADKELFFIVLALDSSEISNEVQETINSLAFYGGVTVEQLYSENLNLFLPQLTKDFKKWTQRSKNVSLFSKLASRTLQMNEPIMQVVVFNSKQMVDEKVRSAMIDVVFACIRDSSFSLVILEQVVVTNAAWNDSGPGLRIKSLNLLNWMLRQRFVDPPCLKFIWGKLFPVLKTCARDDFCELRLVSLKVFETIIQNFMSELELLEICDIYPELLVKLDDFSEEIRVLACICFCMYFDGVHSKRIRQGNFRYILQSLFDNLDDSSEVIQKHVMQVLRTSIKLDKEEFLKVAKDVQKTHRHQRAVLELITAAQGNEETHND